MSAASGIGSDGILADVRVLDVTSRFSGDVAAMLLADFGADVLKVEPPAGDPARSSAAHHMWNRGKKSLVLDLKNDSNARLRLRELAGEADVVLTSWRPGRSARYGLDWTTLSVDNPEVVLCEIEGFGPASEFAELPGYEGIVGAKAGLWLGADELSGAAIEVDGSKRPVYKAIPINSCAAAQLAVLGVLAALTERKRSGMGQRVTTSLLQAALAVLMREGFGRTSEGTVERTQSDALLHRGIALTFMTAECSDGRWIQMCARQDKHFRNWLHALELDDHLAQERYAAAPLGFHSIADIEELESLIRSRMLTRPRAEWLQLFTDSLDVGADPFLTPSEFLAHPQMVQNDRVVTLSDPEVGMVKQTGSLVIVDHEPLRTSAAPALGDFASAAVASPWRGGSRVMAGGAVHLSRAEGLPRADSSARGPLKGCTVLEVAHFLAGPLGPTMLAELGARVIKVEPPTGDPFRRTGRQFAQLVHGKQSVAVDLKHPSGQKILQDLLSISDAVVHNYRPGVAERIGLNPKELLSHRPDLIYVYAAAYGNAGPQAHRAAFHSTPSALCGAGVVQAGIGNAPVDDSWPDPISGLSVSVALALGLYRRRQSGLGGYFETSMLASAALAFSEYLTLYDQAPEVAMPDRGQHGTSALNRLYECQDGWLFLSVRTVIEIRALLHHLEIAELEVNDEVGAMLSTRFLTQTAGEWEKQLTAAGVPAVRADGDSLPDFLLKEGLLSPRSHPEFGDYWSLPTKVFFSRTPGAVGAAAGIGEHTASVLAELGYTPEDMARLAESGAIRTAD
jgi:crotonobetainyl-CoA:carnitine CoA-transferase CaiB-like acyl-CoA transferase